MDPDIGGWPLYPGDYVIGDPASHVAILIVGRGAVDVPPDLFCIKGIMKTENVGLEKVLLNIISNPMVRFLIVCGKEEFGHFPADALLKLGPQRHGRREEDNRSAERHPFPVLLAERGGGPVPGPGGGGGPGAT